MLANRIQGVMMYKVLKDFYLYAGKYAFDVIGED